MARTCDILVIGGGVMGTSLGFHLAGRAVGKVLVLERSFLGAGSSGKSGAIIRQHYSNPLTARMAQHSLKVFERFDEIVGGPPVFTRSGLVLVVHQKDLTALETNLAMQREIGIDTKLVSAQELSDLDPNVLLDAEEVAAWEPAAGYVEAVQVVTSLADAARRDGAEICEGVEVKNILVEKDQVVGVETNEGRIETRCVVIAAGPWASRLTKPLKVDLPVQACRTQVALFRKPPAYGRRVATYGDFVQGLYFKPTHGEMIHAGSIAGEEANDPVDPENYNETADSDWTKTIRQKLTRRYPGMYRCYGRGGYGALYAITPDWHPILDRVPGIQGAYAAIGFSGHGFKLSPMVGMLMTELIVDGQASTLDIAALRATRFAEKDPVTTPYSYAIMG